ncbi:hypothetical protein GQ43DRAFT_169289 [Delitschia confertaspora ATCC 74209]|uniref:Uncharacterized protein n=1 Tax=Delitschia confertaspora ATCC 74209 TaxID=1513339 RepID=A0A9P4JFF2_9PLEO|nr:hypothetical protein GQ43DRAFT_169289 [Delitschia confertaspora ATCC 74209]
MQKPSTLPHSASQTSFLIRRLHVDRLQVLLLSHVVQQCIHHLFSAAESPPHMILRRQATRRSLLQHVPACFNYLGALSPPGRVITNEAFGYLILVAKNFRSNASEIWPIALGSFSPLGSLTPFPQQRASSSARRVCKLWHYMVLHLFGSKKAGECSPGGVSGTGSTPLSPCLTGRCLGVMKQFPRVGVSVSIGESVFLWTTNHGANLITGVANAFFFIQGILSRGKCRTCRDWPARRR